MIANEPTKNTSTTIDTMIKDFLIWKDERGFSTHQKTSFFKQLSYLLQGGVGIAESLQTIEDTTDNFALKSIAHQLLQFISTGKSLSFGMIRLHRYFDTGDVTIVKAGEKSGKLPTVMGELANEYFALQKIKGEFSTAMMYPIILLFGSILAVVILFTTVLPRIFVIAEQFPGMELPWITRFLQSISLFFVDNIGLMIILSVVFIMVGSIFLATNTGAKIMFQLVSEMPVIGSLVQSYYVVRFAKYQKLMLSAGINYIESTKLVQDILDMPAYDDMFQHIITSVTKGGTLYEAMSMYTYLLPSTAIALVKVGEKTGSLPSSFATIAEIYDEELQTGLKSLSKIIEPIMMIFIGGIIVVVALGVFGVITNIMNAVDI